MLLIVDNDLGFAQFVLEAARKVGLQGPGHAARAPRRSRWPREYQPHAITLDISLPDIDGWRVLERLKNDLAAAAHSRCTSSRRTISRSAG